MSDTGARFGGDEFAIVLPGGQVRDAEALARRVLQSVSGTLIPVAAGRDRHDHLVDRRCGRGVPRRTTRDLKLLAERLIAEADAALYKSKAAGRNCVTVSATVVT